LNEWGSAFITAPQPLSASKENAWHYDGSASGAYQDRETSLAYNMARDYSPEIGRYIQSDPIGLTGGLNTYAYVYSKPTKKADPSGMFSDADWEMIRHFYDGTGTYLDISRWCGDYLSDPAILQRMNAAEQKIQRETASLAGSLADGQSVDYFDVERNTNYVTKIYSFGSGNIHTQAIDCKITGYGHHCCAKATCTIRFVALDRFDDPLDLCQRFGICTSIRNVGGTPFWFGLRCDEGFSASACKKK